MQAENNSSQPESWFSVPNPLLDRLPRYSGLEDIIDALAFNPLSGIDMNQLSFMERDGLLTGEKVPLEPTMQSARAASKWYGMLIAGLRVRNPVLAANRANYWAALNAAYKGALLPAPTAGISVNVVKGPTGTGKTVTQQRFCASLPQVIDHGRQDTAGWNNLRQLVYLIVPVSHDGTRGGFLQGILQQMDASLGTNYAIDLPRRFRTTEKLAVATIGRLLAHYCGILFVDEGQLRNLVESGQAELMQMFLLLIVNSGIPLVLTGNERAFDWISYSQDLSRLSLTPETIFAPIGALNDPDADTEWIMLADGVMGYYVLRQPITDPDDCSTILRRCSGGIAREALKLWCMAQSGCLYNGRETVTPTDIELAYESIAYRSMRPLVDGFHYRKPELLLIYPDVNAAFYAAHWKVPLHDADEHPSHHKSDATSKYEADKKQMKRPSEKGKFKREQTRKRKDAEKRQNLQQTLSPEDIRMQGLVNHHLDGLAATMAKYENKAD